MRKMFNWLLLAFVTTTLCACGGEDREEAITSDVVGKTLPLIATILILDLNDDNQISKSPTANSLGMALSFETLSGCTGCNYYQGGTFRQMLSPGSQISITSAYKAVPASPAINTTPVNYFVVKDALGTTFAMPEYELANVTGMRDAGLRSEALLLERLLGEYTDPAEQKPFFLKVQPNWLKQGHPELVPPYTSEAVATYFDPLISGLNTDSFSGLEIHPDEFFISLKATKPALAQIILYTEGLKFDIIPAYGLSVMETPDAPVLSTP